MKLGLGAVLISAATFAVACSAQSSDDTGVSSDSALRALEPEEILGEIKYGETKTVDLTTTPKYRAFYFYGERNDQIQITATALDATDPIVWFLDDEFNTIAQNNDARVTDTSALISGRYLPKTGKYYVAFRDVYNAPQAKFAVAVRKMGVLPANCDPDGEGTWDSACTDPPGYDPFDPNSCTGDDLTADAAKKMFATNPNGFKPSLAAVYYNTRQCIVKPGADPDCSPWVYAFAMDNKLVTVKPQDGVADAYEFASDTTRKSGVDFNITPAGLTEACVDGPFAQGPLSTPTSEKWTPYPNSYPGICTTQLAGLASKVTLTCARFELPSITLGSGDPSHYTELSPVLYAKF